MRRIRRAQERYARANRLFKRRVIAAGTAAALSLATGTTLAQSTGLVPGDKHQLSVPQDADRDFLADAEEFALGYRPFRADQNRNGLPDGAELAGRCAGAIAQLPTEDAATDPGQAYKKEMLVFGLETCAICGETVNMGELHVVNPRLGLDVRLPIIAAHYMEHGSFGYAGDVHEGRVDVPRLMRALNLRFPHEPNEHQLPLESITAAGERVAPDANDLDGDLLADSEELAAGQNLYDPDQNENLLPDGIELAQRCAEIIERLPTFDAESPDAKGVYKIDFMMRGLEWCDTCGESVNMGYYRIVNATSGAFIEVPVIAWHYMKHGSLSHLGDVHAGRGDVAALWNILELPARCGDLGTLSLPADLNGDCKVNIADFAEMARHWLESTDPAPK